MTKSDRWKQRSCVQRYWRFKDKISGVAMRQGFTLTDALHYFFIIAMPKSWPKKKKEKMQGKPHKTKPDIDNILKSVFDSLLGDDSKISSIASAKKTWGVLGEIIIWSENPAEG